MVTRRTVVIACAAAGAAAALVWITLPRARPPVLPVVRTAAGEAKSGMGAPTAADEGDVAPRGVLVGAAPRPPRSDASRPPAPGPRHADARAVPRRVAPPAAPQSAMMPADRDARAAGDSGGAAPVPARSAGPPPATTAPASATTGGAAAGASPAPAASSPAAGGGGSTAGIDAGVEPPAPAAAPRAPVLTPPRVIASPGAVYPDDAFRLTVRRQDLGAAAVIEGSEGTVVVRALVLASGDVQSVEVTASSGSDALDRAAAKAVRGWRFAPATRDGAPIDAYVTLKLRYAVR